mgnify:CR=1 FL=1
MGRRSTKLRFVNCQYDGSLADLSDEERIVYDHLTDELRAAGILHALDHTLILRYATTFVRYRKNLGHIRDAEAAGIPDLRAYSLFTKLDVQLQGELTKLGRLIGLGAGARKNLHVAQETSDPIEEWRNVSVSE